MKQPNMIPIVSVLMITYNMEQFIRESIESILKQSFADFECIIIDKGSTDGTRDIINSYTDKRIILIQSYEDQAHALNWGFDVAKGKYIALMDAANTMHVDRLKIQQATMEAEPLITVCGSWMTCIGISTPPGCIKRTLSRWIEDPFISLMNGNFLFYSTAMIRKSFLVQHNLLHEKNRYTDTLKLWIEIVKRGGEFYIDNQSLVYYRMPETKKTDIKEENDLFNGYLLDELITSASKQVGEYPELGIILTEMQKLEEKEIITHSQIISFFHSLLLKNRVLMDKFLFPSSE